MVKSKKIVVTGASSGIGYHIAKSFQADGHHVIGCSRSKPKQPYEWNHMLCDVSDEKAILAFVKAYQTTHDTCDVLINCAGMGIGGALEHTDYSAALYLHKVNVLGPFALIKAFIPLLEKSNRPKIINIGSVGGPITIPFQAFYSMSKAALGHMTEALRMELKPFGIDATTVLPGDTKSNFTVNRQKSNHHDERYQGRVEKSIRKMESDEMKGMSPLSVVKVVKKQIKKRRMKVFVTVGIQYKLFMMLNKFLPARMKERIIYRIYGK